MIALPEYGLKAIGLVKTTLSASKPATASTSPLSTPLRNGCMSHLAYSTN